MVGMARAWLRSCTLYTTTDTETWKRAYKTHAADTHEAVLRLYACLGESALSPTVLERVHCHSAMLAELDRMDMCVAWLDERYIERRHLRLKLLFQASQRCGGFMDRRDNIRDTLTAMFTNAAALGRALAEANVRVTTENTKSGVHEALARLYDTDDEEDARQELGGDDADGSADGEDDYA